MRIRSGFSVLVVLFLAVFASATPAAAQLPGGIRLHVGVGIALPPGTLGPAALIELPLKEMGSGVLSVVAGGGYLTGGGSFKAPFGGGVRYTTELTPKLRVYLQAVAGAYRHPGPVGDPVWDFGASPGAGIIVALTPSIDFFAGAGLFVVGKVGGKALGAQIMTGVSVPIGR